MAGLVVAGVIILSISGAGDVDSDDDAWTVASVIKLGVGLLLILLAVRQWRGRPHEGEEAKAPKWMQAIDSVTPVKALGLGALLSSINPKNLALTLGAAVAVAQAGLSTGDTAIVFAVFVIIASLGIAVPVLYYLVGGKSAEKTMDSWKSWLMASNATVMAVLLLVMGVTLLGKGIGGGFDQEGNPRYTCPHLIGRRNPVMCLGCLFIGMAATFPRLGLLFIWAFTDWVDIAFDYTLFGLKRFITRGDTPLTVGKHDVRRQFAYDGGGLRSGA